MTNPEIQIRTALPADAIELHALHVRAFDGRPNEANLVTLLINAKKAHPSLVAITNNKILAHALFSPMTLEPHQKDLRLAGLGPIAVLPEYQHRGIGSELIREGIDHCRQSGIDAIAVLGGIPFYTRFGFQSARPRGLTNEYVQDDHFMVLELRPNALANITGLMKYAPEFRQADC